MRKTYLKIKICSLAAEAAIIHREESRWRERSRPYRAAIQTSDGKEPLPNAVTELRDADLTFWGLREHRTGVVRPECRASLIAYGLIRGLPYSKIERPRAGNEPDWARVERIVARFGQDIAGVNLEEFRQS